MSKKVLVISASPRKKVISICSALKQAYEMGTGV